MSYDKIIAEDEGHSKRGTQQIVVNYLVTAGWSVNDMILIYKNFITLQANTSCLPLTKTSRFVFSAKNLSDHSWCAIRFAICTMLVLSRRPYDWNSLRAAANHLFVQGPCFPSSPTTFLSPSPLSLNELRVEWPNNVERNTRRLNNIITSYTPSNPPKQMKKRTG